MYLEASSSQPNWRVQPCCCRSPGRHPPKRMRPLPPRSMMSRTHLSVAGAWGTYDWAAPEVTRFWAVASALLQWTAATDVMLLSEASQTAALRRRRCCMVATAHPICHAQLESHPGMQVLMGHGANEKSDVWSFGEAPFECDSLRCRWLLPGAAFTRAAAPVLAYRARRRPGATWQRPPRLA